MVYYQPQVNINMLLLGWSTADLLAAPCGAGFPTNLSQLRKMDYSWYPLVVEAAHEKT